MIPIGMNITSSLGQFEDMALDTLHAQPEIKGLYFGLEKLATSDDREKNEGLEAKGIIVDFASSLSIKVMPLDGNLQDA